MTMPTSGFVDRSLAEDDDEEEDEWAADVVWTAAVAVAVDMVAVIETGDAG